MLIMELERPKMLVVIQLRLLPSVLHQENAICRCYLAHEMINCEIAMQ